MPKLPKSVCQSSLGKHSLCASCAQLKHTQGHRRKHFLQNVGLLSMICARKLFVQAGTLQSASAAAFLTESFFMQNLSARSLFTIALQTLAVHSLCSILVPYPCAHCVIPLRMFCLRDPSAPASLRTFSNSPCREVPL